MGQLRRAVELEPNHPGAHLAAAELAAKQGNFDLAAEHLQRARRLGYRIDPQLEKRVADGRRASSS
jgi:Tfp pilus assembly protein PilF